MNNFKFSHKDCVFKVSHWACKYTPAFPHSTGLFVLMNEWVNIHSVKAYLQVNQDAFDSGKPYHKVHEIIMCMKTYFASFFQ